ncbi:MAG: leucyl aminopeptidase [Acidimicrobiales bacterium]
MTLALVQGSGSEDGITRARPVFAGLVDLGGSSDPDAVVLEAQGCKGDLGECGVVPDGDASIAFVVGLGPKDELDAEACRRAGATLARATKNVDEVTVDLRGVERDGLSATDAICAFGEGAALGAYRFNGRQNRSNDTAKLARLVLVGPDDRSTAKAISRASARAEAVSLARDLVNAPAVDKTPTRFAEIATEVGSREGLSVTIYEEAQIREMGLGGLWAVAKGSAEPPRLVRIEYTPENPLTTVALVGKGITFDSGGISLKPLASLFTMKDDCGGAAAVLGAMSACRAHDVRVKVVGFLPLTENMPGGRAQKPGDVFTARNGKTVEVLNTDAEGRLVLSDALSLAAEEAPDAIVDIATLTGPIIVALGRQLAGLMGNDSRIVDAVQRAAAVAGEPVWHLPLPAAYRKLLETDVADLKNIGPIGEGGSLVAGLVLEEFVGDVPWAHLDIAGVAWTDQSRGYLQKGGTGFGVRTLIELLEHYEPIGDKSEANPKGRKVIR